MTKWIKCSEQLPPCYQGKNEDSSIHVWVTDGEIIEIATYIYRPRNYGCAVDDDEQKATCGPQSHWHIGEETPSFKEGSICFGRIENHEITHWMMLPEPPNE